MMVFAEFLKHKVLHKVYIILMQKQNMIRPDKARKSLANFICKLWRYWNEEVSIEIETLSQFCDPDYIFVAM